MDPIGFMSTWFARSNDCRMLTLKHWSKHSACWDKLLTTCPAKERVVWGLLDTHCNKPCMVAWSISGFQRITAMWFGSMCQRKECRHSFSGGPGSAGFPLWCPDRNSEWNQTCGWKPTAWLIGFQLWLKQAQLNSAGSLMGNCWALAQSVVQRLVWKWLWIQGLSLTALYQGFVANSKFQCQLQCSSVISYSLQMSGTGLMFDYQSR